MANVLHRITKEYRRSVNDPDFSIADWIINPGLSAVEGFPAKYWTITGDVVFLMPRGKMDEADAMEAADQKALRDTADDEAYDAYERAKVSRP